MGDGKASKFPIELGLSSTAMVDWVAVGPDIGVTKRCFWTLYTGKGGSWKQSTVAAPLF